MLLLAGASTPDRTSLGFVISFVFLAAKAGDYVRARRQGDFLHHEHLFFVWTEANEVRERLEGLRPAAGSRSVDVVLLWRSPKIVAPVML